MLQPCYITLLVNICHALNVVLTFPHGIENGNEYSYSIADDFPPELIN